MVVGVTGKAAIVMDGVQAVVDGTRNLEDAATLFQRFGFGLKTEYKWGAPPPARMRSTCWMPLRQSHTHLLQPSLLCGLTSNHPPTTPHTTASVLSIPCPKQIALALPCGWPLATPSGPTASVGRPLGKSWCVRIYTRTA